MTAASAPTLHPAPTRPAAATPGASSVPGGDRLDPSYPAPDRSPVVILDLPRDTARAVASRSARDTASATLDPTLDADFDPAFEASADLAFDPAFDALVRDWSATDGDRSAPLDRAASGAGATPPRVRARATATMVAAGPELRGPMRALVPPECAGADVRTEAEFTDLYENHFSELAAQVCAYLGDATEAQDLVQEAFLRAWQRWDRVGGYEEPVAWVRRVAWNLATSRHRRNQVARRFLQKSSTPEPAPAASPDHVALVAALKSIPAKRRQALVMHYMADMTVAAIAKHTGAREGTVKSWLHRGRKELAALLREEQAEEYTTGDFNDTMPIRVRRGATGAAKVPRPSGRRPSVKEDRS